VKKITKVSKRQIFAVRANSEFLFVGAAVSKMHSQTVTTK